MKIALLALCLTLPIAAQAQPAGGGQRPPRMSYETSKEVSLQGTVSSVNTRSQGPGKIVTLTLQTQSKGVEIMVGPEFILKAKNFTFATGDEITVVGAPMAQGYVARQITRGSETLTLLDESGQPTGNPGGGAPPQGEPPQQ
ncbi:hypothetical protein [Holophaga foetida]|uniref:hypothetical protein n=1 Tax=Holophaga foetida TaxID=35839 RepID=UPI0002475072|nr:hypothetical protein [Holophaga foetida]